MAVRVGESVAVGGPVKITIIAISGNRAQVTLDADRAVPIKRVPSEVRRDSAMIIGVTGKPEPQDATGQ